MHEKKRVFNYLKILEQKMMNKILPFLGIIFISLIFYKRLFQIRLPRNILEINEMYFLFLYMLLFFIQIVIIILLFYSIHKSISNKEKKSSTSFLKIKALYESPLNPLNMWLNSLVALDVLIKNNIPLFDNKHTYFEIILFKVGLFCNKYKKQISLIILGLIICSQSIVLLCLIIDVFVKHTFFFFYKSLVLLLIPLILKYFIYSIKTLIDVNFNFLDNFLVIDIIKKSDYRNDTSPKDFVTVTSAEWYFICNYADDEYLAFNYLNKNIINNYSQDETLQVLNSCLKSLNDLFSLQSFIDQNDLSKNYLMVFNITKAIIYATCWFFVVYVILK